MSNHFVVYCRHCQDTISQCRCPGPGKEVRYSECKNCKVGDLENEQGFLEGEIDDLRDQLSAKQEQLIRVNVELTQAYAEAFNE